MNADDFAFWFVRNRPYAWVAIVLVFVACLALLGWIGDGGNPSY